MPFAAIENRAVAYRETGPKSAPAVLLAHPLGMSQAVWDHVVMALGDRYRLITWDLPGHGASASIHGPISADNLADEAIGLLNTLGIDKAHFVGTSIGGTVGQALLTRAPDRLDRIALTNTGAIIGSEAAWHERAARVRSEGLKTMAADLVVRWFAPDFQTHNPITVAGWQQQLARCDDESYARLCELLAQADFTGQLKHVSGTVALLAGTQDAATPPSTLEALANELASAELTVFDTVAHVPSVETPDAFASWLRGVLD